MSARGSRAARRGDRSRSRALRPRAPCAGPTRAARILRTTAGSARRRQARCEEVERRPRSPIPVPPHRETSPSPDRRTRRADSSSSYCRAHVSASTSAEMRAGSSPRTASPSAPPARDRRARRARACGLHHRAYVVGPLLERRQRREWQGVGHAGAALVEADQPAEGRERRRKRAIDGSSHMTSTFVDHHGMNTRSSGPSPTT